MRVSEYEYGKNHTRSKTNKCFGRMLFFNTKLRQKRRQAYMPGTFWLEMVSGAWLEMGGWLFTK